MARRHPALIPLSHDHHHTLALALRLVQGDAALLNDGWTHDRLEQVRRVKELYAGPLRRHFAAEEEVLFPAMRAGIAGVGTMIDRLLHDHREIAALIDALSPDDPANPGPHLETLGRLIERHIRAEERELFPLFSTGLAAAAQDEVAKRLSAAS
jgi:iron-sulfur cluster repair protein YtfE (RIC family)